MVTCLVGGRLGLRLDAAPGSLPRRVPRRGCPRGDNAPPGSPAWSSSGQRSHDLSRTGARLNPAATGLHKDYMASLGQNVERAIAQVATWRACWFKLPTNPRHRKGLRLAQAPYRRAEPA